MSPGRCLRSCSFAVSVLVLLAVQAFPESRCGLQVTSYAGRSLFRTSDMLIFTSGMTIDADGSPHAYHPDDVSGLDDLSNAGSPGHWYGIATIEGKPVVQGPDEPAPSFFVSTTSLADRTYPRTSTARYVDSEQIPFIALPSDLEGPELGDIVYVFNTRTHRSSPAIFADQGPVGKIGEGSIALARRLGINPDAREGGTDDAVVFVIFLHSGEHTPLPSDEITNRAELLSTSLEVPNMLECISTSE